MRNEDRVLTIKWHAIQDDMLNLEKCHVSRPQLTPISKVNTKEKHECYRRKILAYKLRSIKLVHKTLSNGLVMRF